MPAAYGRLALFAGRLRAVVKDAIRAEGPRRLFWEQTVDGTVGELVLAGKESAGGGTLAATIAGYRPACTGGRFTCWGLAPVTLT